jgi:hypothetical protein
METPLERLLQHYWPGVSNRQLVDVFDKRIDRTSVANWRSGHRRMPHWAIARLEQEIKAFEAFGHDLVGKLAAGPTRRANAIYLKRWHATRYAGVADQLVDEKKNAPA